MNTNPLFPLTNPEKRIWFTQKLYEGTTMWNIPHTVKFKDDISFEILEKTINQVIRANEAYIETPEAAH